MIRYLKEKHGIRDICFYDDVFTVFKKRLLEICDGLKEDRYKVSWSCQAHVNSVDYETLKMMKDAGCWKISFGIESGSNDILRLMNKYIVVEQSRKALVNAKRAGLEVEGYFILGFFGETINTVVMSAKAKDDIWIMMRVKDAKRPATTPTRLL
jgi:Fe-S oxidoreductase